MWKISEVYMTWVLGAPEGVLSGNILVKPETGGSPYYAAAYIYIHKEDQDALIYYE